MSVDDQHRKKKFALLAHLSIYLLRSSGQSDLSRSGYHLSVILVSRRRIIEFVIKLEWYDLIYLHTIYEHERALFVGVISYRMAKSE